MKSPAPTSSMTASATSATTSAPRSRCVAAPAVDERPLSFRARRQVRPRRLERRNDAEEQTADGCRAQSSRATRAGRCRSTRRAEGPPAATRESPARRAYASSTPMAAPSVESSKPSTSRRADEAPAARAERGTDPHLAPAHGRARQHQVRDVRTRDQQHERDRAEQEQHPAAHPTDQVLLQGDDARAAPRTPLRVLLRRAPTITWFICSWPAAASRRFSACRSISAVVVPAVAPHLVFRAEASTAYRPRSAAPRRPGRRSRAACTPTISHDCFAQLDRLSDHIRRAAEAPLPESVAQDHDAMTSVDLIVHRELAPEQRLHAQQREELPRHALRLDFGWFAALVLEPSTVFATYGDAVERILHPAPVADTSEASSNRSPKVVGRFGVVLEHDYQTVVFVKGEGPQERRRRRPRRSPSRHRSQAPAPLSATAVNVGDLRRDRNAPSGRHAWQVRRVGSLSRWAIEFRRS